MPTPFFSVPKNPEKSQADGGEKKEADPADSRLQISDGPLVSGDDSEAEEPFPHSLALRCVRKDKVAGYEQEPGKNEQP